MKCPKCGKDVNRPLHFCPFCGAELPKEGTRPEAESSPAPRKPEKPFPRKFLIAGAVLAALLLVLFLLMSGLLGGSAAERLEEQLRLGAAYLEEMNFDMALDAYAAAIEIDERDPRPYVGRSAVYRERAEQTIENARSEEDLTRAREDLARAAEDLIKAEERMPAEENEEGMEDIRQGQEEIRRIQEIAGRRHLELSDIDIDQIAQEVLGLPYIGNTDYYETGGGGAGDLYDGRGYISAILRDLDADTYPEILVVSLEGEDTLGRGRNALYLHVLEYADEAWSEAARKDLEDPDSSLLLSDALNSFDKGVFLREEEGAFAIYTEAYMPNWSGSEGWALHRYEYRDGSIQRTSVGEEDPSETDLLAPYYFYQVPGFYSEDYMEAGDPARAARFWQILRDLSGRGHPVLEGDTFLSRGLYQDPSFLPLAAFVRTALDFAGESLHVNLIDYVVREEEDLTWREMTWDEQEAAYEAFLPRLRLLLEEYRYLSFDYYDIDGDGIFELLVNQPGALIYTLRGPHVVPLSLDYEAEENEYLLLGVTADGRTLLSARKNGQMNQYYETEYDYTYYQVTLTDTALSLDQIASFHQSYDDIPQDLRDHLGWFSETSPHGINISDLVYRLQSQLKYNYGLTQQERNGNILSGILFKSQGDGAITGGSAEIDLDTGRATVRYEAYLEDYYGTENLNLR